MGSIEVEHSIEPITGVGAFMGLTLIAGIAFDALDDSSTDTKPDPNQVVISCAVKDPETDLQKCKDLVQKLSEEGYTPILEIAMPNN